MPIRNGNQRGPLSYRLATWGISFLPYTLLGWAARIGGFIHYWTSPGKRRNYLANTKPAVEFGPGRPPWRSFQSQSLNVLELLKTTTAPEQDIRERMSLHGREHIDAVLARGRGIILATFHSGNWELGGLFLSMNGVPITTIAGEQLRPGWSEQVKALKERFGIKMLGLEQPLRDLYRALEANQALALHIDGDLFAGGHNVSFLGKQITAPRGPSRLSRVMSTPVALTYCRRRPDNHLDVIVEPPMAPPADIAGEREMTQSLMSRVEKCIVDDPGQWCIFRKLSKTDVTPQL